MKSIVCALALLCTWLGAEAACPPASLSKQTLLELKAKEFAVDKERWNCSRA
jgi:hypothetical protein